MNVLVLDYTLAKTHVDTNMRDFKFLSKIAKVYLVNSGHYYDALKEESNIELMDTEVAQNNEKYMRYWKGKHSVLARLLLIKNIVENKKVVSKLKDIEFDYVLVTGYEILTFPLLWRYISNQNVILFEHQQITEFGSKLKYMFFSMYKNKLAHIVLEDVFADYLRSIGVKRVFVLHYLDDGYLSDNLPNNVEIRDNFFSALSNTNDENKIEKIIQKEKETGILERSGIQFHIRSKKHMFDDGFLKVDDGFYSTERYNTEIASSQAIVSLVSDDFGYRASGQIRDAVFAQKAVIAGAIPFALSYKEQIPSGVIIYHSIEELLEILCNYNQKINFEEYDVVKERHSPQRIQQELMHIFSKNRNE